MIIRSYEIKNYRSCIETKFSLPENLAALIGVNGVGKSNILYGLQLFNKSERTRLFFSDESKEGFLTTNINLTIEFEGKIIFVRSKFYYDTDERNVDEVYATEVKYRIAGENPRSWQSVDNEIFEFVAYTKRRKFKELPKQFQGGKANFSINLINALANISYYSATQFSDPSRCPVSIELDDYGMGMRRRDEKTHQRFIYDLYTTLNVSKRKFNLFLNTVGPNGLNLIEHIDFQDHKIPSSSYKVRTGGEIQKIENSKRIIIPSITIDGLKLSPNQLSEGTFKTLALVFYILNDTNEILLIEEPEVCVHHGLLSSIIELIKQQSLDKQIIISTHSDYVLDMLKPENVLLVRRENEYGTKAQPLTKALSRNEYEILKDYLRSSGNLGEYWKEGGFDDE